MPNTAILSNDAVHRLRLERDVPPFDYTSSGPTPYPLATAVGQTVAVFMVNPSTAGVETNDATIRKLFGFAGRWGFARFLVGNKFTFRTKDIDLLGANSFRANHPEADKHLEQIMRDADFHVAAWGSLNKLPKVLRQRWKDVVYIADKVGCKLHCIGTPTADGHPFHPVMRGYSHALEEWQVPYIINRKGW